MMPVEYSKKRGSCFFNDLKKKIQSKNITEFEYKGYNSEIYIYVFHVFSMA